MPPTINEADRATQLFNCAVWNQERADELRRDAAHIADWHDFGEKDAILRTAERLERQAEMLFIKARKA